MSGLLDLLKSDLGKAFISNASKNLGEKESTTTTALSTGLPLLLGAMQNNIKSEEGAVGLLGALTKKQDGGILNNLGNVLGNTDTLTDGAGILGHLFNGKEQNIAQAVSKKSGMNLNSAIKLLKMAAPFIMSYLGKQTKSQKVTGSKGITNMLGGLLGAESNKNQQLVTSLLDADGDGSIIDDVIGIASKGKSNKGLGGLLKGFMK